MEALLVIGSFFLALLVLAVAVVYTADHPGKHKAQPKSKDIDVRTKDFHLHAHEEF